MANSLFDAFPSTSKDMEPSPKKLKQDVRNLTEHEIEAIRKVMAGLEKNLKGPFTSEVFG